MNSSEIEKFECFLAESFKGGVMLRELRLSAQELEYLSKKYPRANLKKIELSDYSDHKLWYEVSFSS